MDLGAICIQVNIRMMEKFSGVTDRVLKVTLFKLTLQTPALKW